MRKGYLYSKQTVGIWEDEKRKIKSCCSKEGEAGRGIRQKRG